MDAAQRMREEHLKIEDCEPNPVWRIGAVDGIGQPSKFKLG
jgi:hypothetical protein